MTWVWYLWNLELWNTVFGHILCLKLAVSHGILRANVNISMYFWSILIRCGIVFYIGYFSQYNSKTYVHYTRALDFDILQVIKHDFDVVFTKIGVMKYWSRAELVFKISCSTRHFEGSDNISMYFWNILIRFVFKISCLATQDHVTLYRVFLLIQL